MDRDQADLVFVDIVETWLRERLSGDEGRIAGYEIKTDDLYRAPATARQIHERIGGYPFQVKSWVDLNGALFAALKLEKYVMGLLLSIMQEQFKYINLFGGLLGFLIGLANLIFLSLR